MSHGVIMTDDDADDESKIYILCIFSLPIVAFTCNFIYYNNNAENNAPGFFFISTVQINV